MLVANLETATATRAYAIVRFCAVASELHSAISASRRGSLDCRSRGRQNRLRRASAPTEPVTSAFSSVVAGCPLGHSRASSGATGLPASDSGNALGAARPTRKRKRRS
jgi:hypothetical protein